MGSVLSSCDIYERLEMFTECVECLALAGHSEKAIELANKTLATNPSAKLLCTLGDVTKDFTYYKKAWKFSDKKFARA